MLLPSSKPVAYPYSWCKKSILFPLANVVKIWPSPISSLLPPYSVPQSQRPSVTSHNTSCFPPLSICTYCSLCLECPGLRRAHFSFHSGLSSKVTYLFACLFTKFQLHSPEPALFTFAFLVPRTGPGT